MMGWPPLPSGIIMKHGWATSMNKVDSSSLQILISVPIFITVKPAYVHKTIKFISSTRKARLLKHFRIDHWKKDTQNLGIMVRKAYMMIKFTMKSILDTMVKTGNCYLHQ